MKLTKQQFREFILNEVKKMVANEGHNQSDEMSEKTAGTIVNRIEHNKKDDETKKTISETIVEPKLEIQLDTAKEEPKVELEEVKRLTEEFKRMKELIDFRSPLLKKDE